MRLATIRHGGTTTAVRIDSHAAVDLGVRDVGQLLARPDWRTFARDHAGEQLSLDGLDFAPVVPTPEKIICVGLNYRAHILEMGRELPEFPTLFAKYPRTLVGAFDDIVLPSASDAIDWEAELGVVVGAEVRHADADQARAAIAGYTVINDVTERDWQYRTTQWMQGKNFERTTPMGPYLVTDDAGAGIAAFELSCELDGEVVQRANTADLVFDPVALVAYGSTMVTLVPGDVIATGTPGGVGHARKPARYLTDGAVLTTRIDGVGQCHNTCRAEK